MKIDVKTLKRRGFFPIIVAIQIVVCVAAILDIPFLRQVTGFLYFTFIPGLILLKVLRLRDLTITELVLFAVGLSIGFLMLVGLMVNELGPLAGISKTLTFGPLTTALNVGALVMCIFASRRRNDGDHSLTGHALLKPSPLTFVAFLIPLTSVAGVLVMRIYENNLLLMSMSIAVGALFFVAVLLLQKLSSEIHYLLALTSISLSLLLHVTLISDYVVGYDINVSYQVFQMTRSNSYWDPNLFAWIPAEYNIYNKFGAMLSTTILPTIYSSLLNIEEAWVMKVIYPLIYSLIPLAAYHFHKIELGRPTALLATFFLMANEVFLQPISNAKQMIAELFYVLLFIILFGKRVKDAHKAFLFIVFSFCLIVSHYMVSLVFLCLIWSTWIYTFVTRKAETLNVRINLSWAIVFMVIMLSWYSYLSMSGPLAKFVETNDRIYLRLLTDFLNPESRGTGVQRGLGLVPPESFLHDISTKLFYLTEFIILVGFLTTAFYRRRRVNLEYEVLSVLNMLLVVSAIVLPGLAESFKMDRLYHISLIFICPYFVEGGRFLCRKFMRFKTRLCDLFLTLAVLIPFFLFQIGFVYEFAGDAYPSSISLSWHRMSRENGFKLGLVYENDVFAARWLSTYSTGNRRTYTDHERTLNSYALITSNYIYPLTNNTRPFPESYQFFSSERSDLARFSLTIGDSNKVYSNGPCVIFRKEPRTD